MSANRPYLVCSHHPNPDDALCMTERRGTGEFYIDVAMDVADRWFKKHELCGQNREHLQVAYLPPQDWGCASAAESTPAGAVRLALVNGSH